MAYFSIELSTAVYQKLSPSTSMPYSFSDSFRLCRIRIRGGFTSIFEQYLKNCNFIKEKTFMLTQELQYLFIF